MLAYLIFAQEEGWLDRVAMYALPLIGSTMLAFALYNLVHDLRRTNAKKIAERLKESSGRMTVDGSAMMIG